MSWSPQLSTFATSDVLNARARIAIWLCLNDGPGWTPKAIALALGMKVWTVNRALGVLKMKGAVSNDGSGYRASIQPDSSARNVEGNVRFMEDCSTKRAEPSTKHAEGSGALPESVRNVEERSTKRAEVSEGLTSSRDPSPLPGEGGARVPAHEGPTSRQVLPEGFGDVQDAWLSLPGHERLQLNAIDARQLAGYVSKHGALLVLEAIGSIAQGSANYDYRPPLHWVNDRATRIADRRAKAAESGPTGAQRYATDRHIGEMERLKRDDPEAYAKVIAPTGKVYGTEPITPGAWKR